MDYYCDICGKTNKPESENEHLQSLTHSEFEKCIRIKHTMKITISWIYVKYLTIISLMTIKNSIYSLLNMILN